MAFVFIEDNNCLNIGIFAVEVNRSKRIIKIGIIRLNHDFYMAALFVCFHFQYCFDNAVDIGAAYDFLKCVLHFQRVMHALGQDKLTCSIHIVKAGNDFAYMLTSIIIFFPHMRDVVRTDKFFCFTEIKHQRFGNGMNNACVSRKTFTCFHMLYQGTINTAGFSDIVNCCVFAFQVFSESICKNCHT